MTTERALIETEGLVKAYDLLVVLRQINLSVARGEFVALLGPNGSGKSTLLRLLAGLTRPNGGTIRVGGWELPTEAARVRAQVGMVSHKSLLYDNLTALENLRFFGRLYNLDNLDTRMIEMLEQVGLSKRRYDLVRTFSRGMVQRLTIARALLHDPDILLLDEPYTGLDQDASAILDGLLADSHTQGRTIIMTTHQIERAARIANRVIILSRGRIGYDAPAAAADPLALASIYTETTSMAVAR